MSIAVKFLGVGDAAQINLGHSSCVIEINDRKLLVDLGPGVFDRFFSEYEALPDAVFITHCHLDHIADFERLFIRCWFADHRPLIFVPVHLVKLLNERVGTYPGALAEGNVNFWQAFHLVPVTDHFEFERQRFEVYPARHHGANSAFNLSVEGSFFYTGDTRPIPELLESLDLSNTTIFHDCSVLGNPSHTGLEDLLASYSAEIIERIYVYHYHCEADIAVFKKQGVKTVSSGERFVFSEDST